MRTRLTSARNRRKGNAILESAFVSLVFFMLVFGIFDFGQFLFVHQALVHRARQAIRYGAIENADNTTAIKNRILYGQTTEKMTADGVPATGYFGLTPSMVTVTTSGKNTDNYRVNVTITNFPFTMLSPFVAGSKTSGTPIYVTVPLGLFD
jgi:Flp pilus assembly protein TadG